jgi:uncharacterized membrane protein YphA (DoxX/SURF4 family)
MSFLTRTCLVLLRLAIGWHLLFEGAVKIHSHATGKTTTSAPFTSSPYLREATGPFADFFHEQAGDPDKAALERLSLRPLDTAQESEVKNTDRLSPALVQDWDAYLDRFAAWYELDEKQSKEAEDMLEDAKEAAYRWLAGEKKQVAGKKGLRKADPKPDNDEIEGERPVPKTFAGLTVRPMEKPPQRIPEYRTKLDQLREMQDRALPEFDRDVFKQKLRDRKAEVAKLRTELLDDQNAVLTDRLQTVLTPEQRKKGPPPSADAVRPRDWLPESWPTSLADVRGALPPADGSPTIHWLDWVVRCGLVLAGLGLLLGLFTRTSCLAAFAFLVMLSLAMPALTGVPENLRVEGYYLYVTKNVIEALALLTLATTASGRWLGLDGLWYHILRPWGRRKQAAAPSANGVIGRQEVHQAV